MCLAGRSARWADGPTGGDWAACCLGRWADGGAGEGPIDGHRIARRSVGPLGGRPKRRRRASDLESVKRGDPWRRSAMFGAQAVFGAQARFGAHAAFVGKTDHSPLIRCAFSRTSSMVPARKKACSGRSSPLPSRISLKEATVSFNDT